MARPHKAPEKRRTEQLNISLSPLELAQVRDRAEKTESTVIDFARSAALNKPLHIQETQAVDFETRQELRRIGVNLNQIARVLNAQGKHDSDQLTHLCSKLDLLFDKWL